ncbi:MAG: shikimate kinase [Bacteroidota bacterium]|nr:shikimate kinase [Bacteroidota bacterium]
MKKIYLIGMPGSGKTTIGKKIARELKLDFIDLDSFIEKKENCSIHDIFKYQGEKYFRQVESTYLKEVSEINSRYVVSLGGGTPCFNDNMDVVLASGLSVYIKANEKILLNRLENAKSQRPLFWGLTKVEIEKKLSQLIESRSPFYDRANIIIHAANMNEKDIVRAINDYKAP